MEQTRNDIKISGAGSISGGIYNEVKISGAGNVNGDVDCVYLKSSGSSDIKGNVIAKEIKISGTSKVSGNITTEAIKVSGSADITGNLEAAEIQVSGGSKIGGDIKAKYIKVSGGTEICGNLHSDEVRISGSADIKKDCECETFTASGGFTIEGLLNAGKIDITLYGRCKAKEVGGENINISLFSNSEPMISKIFRSMFLTRSEFITDAIEGDDIFLEATTAKIVRGKNITIGEGCCIDKVEYSGELKVVNGGKVKEQARI